MSGDDPKLGSGLQRDLIPVNAVIGFLKRDRRWPSPLYELGYRLTMIDQPVSTPKAGRAEVDVIGLNHKRNHAILCECKSGRSIDERQARVYAAATAEDVQRTGNITFPRPSSASVEPAYFCLESDAQAISESLSSWGLEIPVVALGREARLVRGVIGDEGVHARFAAGVLLPPLETVPRFLPANIHTPKEKVARALFATMVSFLRKKQTGTFSVLHLLEETFPDWHAMGTDLHRHLNSLAAEIMKEMCENELRGMARQVRAAHSPGVKLVEFTDDVLGQDATARTRTFQKLARLAQGYIERTAAHRPYVPGQEPESLWLPGFEPDSD